MEAVLKTDTTRQILRKVGFVRLDLVPLGTKKRREGLWGSDEAGRGRWYSRDGMTFVVTAEGEVWVGAYSEQEIKGRPRKFGVNMGDLARRGKDTRKVTDPLLEKVNPADILRRVRDPDWSFS